MFVSLEVPFVCKHWNSFVRSPLLEMISMKCHKTSVAGWLVDFPCLKTRNTVSPSCSHWTHFSARTSVFPLPGGPVTNIYCLSLLITSTCCSFSTMAVLFSPVWYTDSEKLLSSSLLKKLWQNNQTGSELEQNIKKVNTEIFDKNILASLKTHHKIKRPSYKNINRRKPNQVFTSSIM